VGKAVETAQHEGRKQAGVPLKSWLWSRKETGRPTHHQTETMTMSEPVPLDQNFVIGTTGVTCPHPRATGRPEHDINCGCTTISRYPNDSVRDLNLLAALVACGFDLDARKARRHEPQ